MTKGFSNDGMTKHMIVTQLFPYLPRNDYPVLSNPVISKLVCWTNGFFSQIRQAKTRGPEIEQDAFEAIQGGEFLHKSHDLQCFIVTNTYQLV